ncbi:MAG: hypothetical protein P8182_07115 [Deltaproteobacteria bacterium]
MRKKYLLEDDRHIFSLSEESDLFRLRMWTAHIEEDHVEDFLETTVDWLSTNPDKGILIDFKGVKSISDHFVTHLIEYYREIKSRGLYVGFVNVDPSLERHVGQSTITVVTSLDMLHGDKPVLRAKEVLNDLAADLSDEELMEKHGLSGRGLRSLFSKLLAKGLISRKALARRWGVETAMVTLSLDRLGPQKARIDAKEVLKDISNNASDREIMRKYKLTAKGLQSLMQKLYRRGLISKATLSRRKVVKRRP